MSNPLTRFSNRVDNYAKYRPTYPGETIQVLESGCGLNSASVIADVGSGTGISAEMFLKNGNKVFAIEPNDPMRASAESMLKTYPLFQSVKGTAEDTQLPDDSVDFVVAAQAFHWFDRKLTKREFARILKPRGWVVLIWNERRLDSTRFLRGYEDLLLRYGVDYQQVRHENVESEIAEFFAPNAFGLETLENAQHLDFPALKGRFLSSSYTPDISHPNFNAMLKELEELFKTTQENETVAIEYETKIFFGQLSQLR